MFDIIKPKMFSFQDHTADTAPSSKSPVKYSIVFLGQYLFREEFEYAGVLKTVLFTVGTAKMLSLIHI